MPNHIHLCLVEREKSLSTFMMVFKRIVSQKAGRGRLWERRFHDNRIGSMKELRKVVEYIHNNPVKARLANLPESYRYSSARDWGSLDLNTFLEFGNEI